MLWGPDTGQARVDPSSIPLPLPPPTDCTGGEYTPVAAEVRVAGRETVDLNRDCDVVAASRFADCWSRLAEIRAWKDDPETTPYFTRVELTGASGSDGCRADSYFARNKVHCLYAVLVEVDWQDRDDLLLNVPTNFRTSCLHPSLYPETPDPDWAADPGDPRVVNLFVVPYGAFKGVQAQDGLPITEFPKFYVTGWGGNGANRDPCPDDDPALPGEIVGYFIADGKPGGPVDETLSCIPGDLRPCRAVLVR